MPVDLGKVGDEYFINVVSAGMVTSIAHEVDTRLKNTFGKLAYYVQGLKTLPQFKALDMVIKADGEEIREKAFLFLIVAGNYAINLSEIKPFPRLSLEKPRLCNIVHAYDTQE